MKKLEARNILSGSHGYINFNGTPVLEIKNANAKAEIMREDVPVGMDVDSKLIALKGSGEFTVMYAYDRGMNELLEAYKRGEDPRVNLTAGINDPDSKDKQRERVTLNNVWFNEMTLIDFTKGEMVGKTYPFGFTVSDAQRPEVING